MKKIIKSFSIFLSIFFCVALSSLNYVKVSGAQIALPNVSVVLAEPSPIAYDKIESFVLSSKNYDGKVQYMLWINKKDSNVWMDMTGGYSEPVSAKKTLIINYDKSLEPGDYNIVAWVKIAGTNGMKLNNSGLGYDNYSVTNLQYVKNDEKQKVSATIYTALGDSIAFGLSADEGKDYVDLFHNHLKTTEKYSKPTLNNLAMSGDKSSDLLEKLKDNDTIREAVKTSNIITISIGGNNLLAPLIETIISECELNPKDPKFAKKLAIAVATDTKLQKKIANIISSEKLTKAFTAGITKFTTDWKSIIEETKLLAPEAEIYVMTLYNPFNAKDPFFNLVNTYIKEINTIIISSKNLYKVADVYTLFKQYKGDKPLTNFNLLTGSVDPHPTNEGHNLILQAHVNAKY